MDLLSAVEAVQHADTFVSGVDFPPPGACPPSLRFDEHVTGPYR